MLFKPCKHEKCTCSWWYEFTIDGRRYRRSTKTAHKDVAGRIEIKRRNAILEGKPEIIPSPQLFAFVKDYVAAVEEEHRSSNKSLRVLDAFKTSIGNLPLDKITPFAIEKWKLARVKVVKQSTVNRELNVIAGLFSRAVKWGKLTESPMPRVEKFNVDDSRVRILTQEEIAYIFANVPKHFRLMFQITLESLPRLSEVLSILRTHIGPTWIERRLKGGKVDRVNITASLRAELIAHLENRSVLFPDKHGKLHDPRAISSLITRQMRALGLAGVSHHTFRHTGVTWMLEAGKNPRVIQKLAGWSSLRMLQRYGHVRDAEAQSAVSTNAARLESAVLEATHAEGCSPSVGSTQISGR